MSIGKQFADTVSGGASLRELATKVGGSHTNVNRKLLDNDPQMIVDVAKAYGVNPIPTLIATHFIRHGDVYTSLFEDDLSSVASVLDSLRSVVTVQSRGAGG